MYPDNRGEDDGVSTVVGTTFRLTVRSTTDCPSMNERTKKKKPNNLNNKPEFMGSFKRELCVLCYWKWWPGTVWQIVASAVAVRRSKRKKKKWEVSEIFLVSTTTTTVPRIVFRVFSRVLFALTLFPDKVMVD